MDIAIERMKVIEEENLPSFELKESLCEVELYGLELILTKLLADCNYEQTGESDMVGCVDTIDSYTVHCEDRLDILDGAYNVLCVNDHYITSAYLTVNGIVVFKCVRVDENYIPTEEEYYVSLN